MQRETETERDRNRHSDREETETKKHRETEIGTEKEMGGGNAANQKTTCPCCIHYVDSL